jgi:hypothetical protein
MLMLTLLAALSRCESSTLCPTDEDIREAITSDNYALIYKQSADTLAENPEGYALMHVEPIKRLSHVICDTVEPNPPTPKVACQFRVRYNGYIEYRSAVMSFNDRDRYRITNQVVVFRWLK